MIPNQTSLKNWILPNPCKHLNITIIKDANWDEHLPVKEVVICTDCNTEIDSVNLYIDPTVKPYVKRTGGMLGKTSNKTFRFSKSQRQPNNYGKLKFKK